MPACLRQPLDLTTALASALIPNESLRDIVSMQTRGQHSLDHIRKRFLNRQYLQWEWCEEARRIVGTYREECLGETSCAIMIRPFFPRVILSAARQYKDNAETNVSWAVPGYVSWGVILSVTTSGPNRDIG